VTTDPGQTGDSRVDEALERLAELDNVDVVHHGARYDDIHATLAAALDDDPVDDDPVDEAPAGEMSEQ
jgi:hypothetical protein